MKKFKRIISLFLSAVMLISGSAVSLVASAAGTEDVSELISTAKQTIYGDANAAAGSSVVTYSSTEKTFTDRSENNDSHYVGNKVTTMSETISRTVIYLGTHQSSASIQHHLVCDLSPNVVVYKAGGFGEKYYYRPRETYGSMAGSSAINNTIYQAQTNKITDICAVSSTATVDMPTLSRKINKGGDGVTNRNNATFLGYQPVDETVTFTLNPAVS